MEGSIPVTAIAPSLVNALPRTDASCSSRRSSAVSPSSLAAMSAWSVSGTSRSSIRAIGVNRFASFTTSPRSMSMRTVSTA